MTDSMTKIAGVRFHDNWKVYDFDATDIDVAVGDKVIIDSDRGLDAALVVRLRRTQEPPAEETSPRVEQKEEVSLEVEEDIPPAGAASSPPAIKPSRGLRKVLRRATEDDLVRERKNRAREAEAFSIAQAMIAERELPMKLIRAEYSFDATRVTFFFFSETRVDFRELVKDLADRRPGRCAYDRRVRSLRQGALLLVVPEELRAGLDPDGQETGDDFESGQDLRRLRQAALLSFL
jgi:hypothetical protein